MSVQGGVERKNNTTTLDLWILWERNVFSDKSGISSGISFSVRFLEILLYSCNETVHVHTSLQLK